jgi:hypothetical protein
LTSGSTCSTATGARCNLKAEDQNAFLKSHGWETYSAWHLGLTDGAADETKARYAFVFGDFRRVHRTALIASVYRASEWRHKEIELAAHDLLQRRRRRGLFVLGHLARSTQACGCGPVGRDDRCVDVLPSGAIFLLVAA